VRAHSAGGGLDDSAELGRVSATQPPLKRLALEAVGDRFHRRHAWVRRRAILRPPNATRPRAAASFLSDCADRQSDDASVPGREARELRAHAARVAHSAATARASAFAPCSCAARLRDAAAALRHQTRTPRRSAWSPRLTARSLCRSARGLCHAALSPCLAALSLRHAALDLRHSARGFSAPNFPSA
jgi:hypothetical protein